MKMTMPHSVIVGTDATGAPGGAAAKTATPAGQFKVVAAPWMDRAGPTLPVELRGQTSTLLFALFPTYIQVASTATPWGTFKVVRAPWILVKGGTFPVVLIPYDVILSPPNCSHKSVHALRKERKNWQVKKQKGEGDYKPVSFSWLTFLFSIARFLWLLYKVSNQSQKKIIHWTFTATSFPSPW